MTNPDPMATPSPNDQTTNSSTTSMPAGLDQVVPPPPPPSPVTLPEPTPVVEPPPIVPEDLQKTLKDKLGYVEPVLPDVSVAPSVEPQSSELPVPPSERPKKTTLGTMLKIGGAVAALVLFIGGGVMAWNIFREGGTTELRSSARSGCAIVDTDQGPGCWCQDGGWQFHCFAGATRGTPADDACRNRCDQANAGEGEVPKTCNNNGVCDFDETGKSCSDDCRDDKSDDGSNHGGGQTVIIEDERGTGGYGWSGNCFNIEGDPQGCVAVLYKCSNQTGTGEQCRQGGQVFRNQRRVCFDENFCGVQQLDLKCTDADSKYDAFQSRYTTCEEGPAPRGSAAPRASLPPGGSPPPEDINTPTPSHQPSSGLLCKNLRANPETPKMGETARFICRSDGTKNVDHFEFRYKVDKGGWVTLPSGTAEGIEGEERQFRGTSDLTITQAGGYRIQCRVCKRADGNCTDWGKAH